MGDEGKMYVSKELLPIYRDEIIPLANIITPNQFEVELLTEKKVRNEQEAWEALQWFHEKNVEVVVLSSSNLGASNELLAFLSQKNGSRCILRIPKVGNRIQFTGTGDLFAALFLAHSYNSNYGEALEKATATIQVILKRTVNAISSDSLNGKKNITPFEAELKIIQSKIDIECPQVLLKANWLN